MPPYRNYIYEYHAKITSGEIIAGKWIKKIYEIIINGLQKQEYFFNAKAANKAIRFIENFCHHSKGRNDLIKLELWQKAIVSVIFGIQDAEKIRIFREIFIVIGRKNGKSLFASAIIAYMAYLEPEYGQEIYCLAPKLDQAALVYDGFYQMVQAEDELAELAKKRRSDIYIAESNTVIKPMSFTERERACGNAIFFSANRLQYASNATKLSVSTQLFDRALLNRNGVMDIWNMAHVEDGEKYYIRKEYTEVSELHKGSEQPVIIQQVPQQTEPAAGEEPQNGQEEKEGVNNAS